MRAQEFIHRQLREDIEDFPIANVRKANGAIGNQGVNIEQAADVLTHAAGMQVSPDMSMRQLVDALKADPAAQQRLRQFVQKNPITVYALPDGSYHLQDGHHRTFLLNLLGDETVPAEVKENVTEAKTVEFEGLTLKVIKQDHELTVDALDDWGNKVLGHVKFNIGDGKELDPQDLHVDDKYQGQGIARVMYDYVKSLGYTIVRSYDQTDAGKGFWDKHRGEDVRVWEQGVAEGATVTRIDSKPITDFGSSLKAYKHTDDWSQSGVDTGDDSYWKNKNLKTNTTKGLFAGDPKRTALYATGNAHETRYVEFTQNGQPIVYFDQKDLPAMRSRKTYLTVFDANDFRQLPTGEWFSENPGKPIKQIPIGDPFKYIASQGWIVRVTDDLDKVFKQVKNMHKAGKIAQYGAEGMNESKQGVAENFADGKNPVKFTVTTPDGYTHSFQITLAVHGKHVGHFNFVRSADTDDVNNEAEVESRWQGQGYGKLLLMKAIDVANNHGLDFQQDIRGITDAQQNVYDSLENAGLIVTPGDGFWFLTPQGEQELNGLNENFADGKNPGRKGLSKRVGVNTKASVSSLRKTAKNSSGEKQRMSHWLANMKAGRAKAKRK
jgi:GNAT superfamily N-acetyltransferase